MAAPPTIQNGLMLITQGLVRSDMSRVAEVTFACIDLTGGTAADAQDDIDDFQANFNATIGAQLDSEVTILKPTIRMGDGSSTPFEAVAAGATIVGGGVVTSLPPNCALLVKKTTGFGGRHNRGRTYFPFLLDESHVAENGTIDNAELSAFNALMATFLAQLSTDGMKMVIAERIFDLPHPPHHVTQIVTTGNPVTSYVCEPLVATQRRRLGR